MPDNGLFPNHIRLLTNSRRHRDGCRLCLALSIVLSTKPVQAAQAAAAVQERRRVETVLKQFREHFPRYKEFTRSVVRLRSDQIARLRLGIDDHAALDQAMVQLDSLIVGYVEKANGLAYGKDG